MKRSLELMHQLERASVMRAAVDVVARGWQLRGLVHRARVGEEQTTLLQRIAVSSRPQPQLVKLPMTKT